MSKIQELVRDGTSADINKTGASKSGKGLDIVNKIDIKEGGQVTIYLGNFSLQLLNFRTNQGIQKEQGFN
jgi:hypothetical protein